MMLPVGIFLAFAFIIGALILEGGNPASLIAVPSLVLVFGGTLAVTATTFSPGQVLKMPLLTIKAFKSPQKLPDAITQIIELAEVARKDGALALESKMSDVDDPFLKHGLTLLVDGADEHRIREELEAAKNATHHRHTEAAAPFVKAAGYAPIIGLIGTTMGLINMLGHLDEPEHIGHSLAIAMAATLYGLLSANVMYTPVADKLTALDEAEMLAMEMKIDGVCSMLHGFSSRAMTERLEAWLSPAQRAKKAA
jgi:chemotaxis protein MotA